MRRKVLDDHVERFLSTFRFCTLCVQVAPKIPVGGVQDRQLSISERRTCTLWCTGRSVCKSLRG